MRINAVQFIVSCKSYVHVINMSICVAYGQESHCLTSVYLVRAALQPSRHHYYHFIN